MMSYTFFEIWAGRLITISALFIVLSDSCPLMAGDPCSLTDQELVKLLPSSEAFDFIESSPLPPLPFSFEPIGKKWVGEFVFFSALLLMIVGILFFGWKDGNALHSWILSKKIHDPGWKIFIALTALFFSYVLVGNLIKTKEIHDTLQTAKWKFNDKAYKESAALLSSAEKKRAGSFVSVLKIVGYIPQIFRPDIQKLRTVVSYNVVRDALAAKKMQEIEMGLGNLERGTKSYPFIQQALLACNNYLGSQANHVGNFSKSFEYHSAAYQIEPRNSLYAGNYYRALLLHLAYQFKNNSTSVTESEQLISTLLKDDVFTSKKDQILLFGMLARAQSKKVYLEKKEKPLISSKKVVDIFSSPYELSKIYDHPHQFIICDLAYALEARAISLITYGDAQKAVECLRMADTIRPGQETTRELLTRAFLVLGNNEMSKRKFEEAIKIYIDAIEETGFDERYRDACIIAYAAWGADYRERGDLDKAIKAFSYANELSPSDNNIKQFLGDVYAQRGTERLKTGHVALAKKDFTSAEEVSNSPIARMQLSELRGRNYRMARLNQSASWLRSPKFGNEVPIDQNRDGRADGYLYYQNGQLMGVSDWNKGCPPQTVSHIIDGMSVAEFKDYNFDGIMDERVDYSQGNAKRLIIDSDFDRLPDMKLFFNNGEVIKKENLSGKVVLRFKDGVIGTTMDIFDGPDAYVKIFKNSDYLGKTSSSDDTYYPIWNKGIVMDFKNGDSFEIQLWDEDVITPDDLIDYYVSKKFPKDGVYKMINGKAALNISVIPTDLPEGHIVDYVNFTDENLFRDYPTSVPEFADIIAGAQTGELINDTAVWAAKTIAANYIMGGLWKDGFGFIIKSLLEYMVEEGVDMGAEMLLNK